MEADFSGYATKAGLVCSDGRTILPDAFKHQDTKKVPLVWQHGHTNPENVLGHVLLENRDDGVWVDAFFNDTAKAQHAKAAVKHGDITMMSIWANGLMQRAKRVMHGMIREVSLVLSGANPGALIDPVSIRHSDDDVEILEDEAIIYTGLTFQHSAGSSTSKTETTTSTKVVETVEDDELTDEDLKKIYATMTDAQKTLVHSVVEHADAGGSEKTVQDIYDSMTEEQQAVLHLMVGEALSSAGDTAQQDGLDGEHLGGNDPENNDASKGTAVGHNVFEQDANKKVEGYVLSHDDITTIVSDATRGNGRSLREAVEDFKLSHGIQDIDILFPEAKSIETTPELFGRRTEWVQKLMSGVRKSPFARIRTSSADLTVQEARAKGYIKGTLKKEEFFRVSKRVTTPTTIYKKQKLDRDDMVDITDFDVVAWLKGEMRLMLDEEVARAILVGDGRDAADDDKINEDHIRPIATDHELYTTTVYVNIDDAGSNLTEVVDAFILNRQYLRGTGLPIMFTTESYIAKFMTLRDNINRRLYKDLNELATELRVSEIVPVEILEEYPDIVGIFVNPVDYVVGADKGGEVNLFDDFDIDYNQYKYLIETRASGALVKLKAALVVRKVAGADQLVVPAQPAFDGTAVTITNQTGVVYRNADTDAVMNAAGSPYAVAEDETLVVHAEPAAGYYFESTEDDDWAFTNQP